MSRERPTDDLTDDDREFSLQDTLDAVRSMDSPTVTTTDIRIILGCSADTARRRLNTLFDKGYLKRRKTGQQTLWWEPDSENPEESGATKTLSPADGPKTNAVNLIEASENDQ